MNVLFIIGIIIIIIIIIIITTIIIVFNKNKYSCNDGLCTLDKNGEFSSLKDCRKKCYKPPGPKPPGPITNYNCDNGNCVQDSKGTFNSLEDCQIKCKGPKPIFPTSGDIYGFGDNISCKGVPSWTDKGPIITGPCPWLYMGSPILELAAKTAIENAPKNAPKSLIFGVGYIDCLADAAPMGACYRNKDRTIIIQKANPTSNDCINNPTNNCGIDMLIAGNGEPNYGCCGIWLSNAFNTVSNDTQKIDYSTWSAYCSSTFNKNAPFCGSNGPQGGGVFSEWDKLGYTDNVENNCKLAFPTNTNLQTACKNIANTKEWGQSMELIPCKAPKELIAVTKLYNTDWQNGNYPENDLYKDTNNNILSFLEVKDIVKEWYEDEVELTLLKNNRNKLILSSDNKMIKMPEGKQTMGHNGCRPENASMDQPGGPGALNNTTRMIACVKSPDADSMDSSISNITLPDTALDVIKDEVKEKGIQVVCDNNDGLNIRKDWINKYTNLSNYSFDGEISKFIQDKMGCYVVGI
jgi:hypothetical protein